MFNNATSIHSILGRPLVLTTILLQYSKGAYSFNQHYKNHFQGLGGKKVNKDINERETKASPT